MAYLAAGDRLTHDYNITGAGHIIRARAPLRISFAGGGTDFPHWYNEHGGAVLSSTINRYAHISLYPRDDREVHIHSMGLGYTVKYNLDRKPNNNGVLDLAKAAVQRFDAEHGMELDVRSDAPPGSGLGGSSAMTAAIIGAVAEYTNRTLSPYDLAELNYAIERIDVGISGGRQDQYATTFGGFNLIEFFKDRVIVNPLRIDQAIINDLEAHTLLCYTGKARSDIGLIDKQIKYYQQGRTDTIAGMSRLYEIAFEMKEALLKGNLDELGLMFNEAYVNKKRMNPDVAAGTIADALYEAARANGALGGKLLGAGGGGYLLIYCEVRHQHKVRQALEAIGGQVIDIAFENQGLQSWRSRCD